jgi:hypothetical protein
MSLLIRFDQDLKIALKQQDAARVSVLRLLKSALAYKQIDKGAELTETEVFDVIEKEIKKRRESIAAYRHRRDDLADLEQREMDMLLTYLPAELSEGELVKVIDQVLALIDESTPFGKIMGAVMEKLKGQRVDGSRVRKLLEQKLI